MDTSGDPPASQEKRRRVDGLHETFVADKDIVRRHGQWRGPGIKAHWDVAEAPESEDVDAATSTLAADR